jgi:hypothetical protein
MSLIIQNRKVQDLYYSSGKLDSFFIYDSLCGEYEILRNVGSKSDFKDSVLYSGCAFTVDLSFHESVDDIYSFYLQRQKRKDSFELNLWFPVEKCNIYSYVVFKDSEEVLTLNDNSPVIRLVLPFNHSKRKIVYSIKKIIQKKNTLYINSSRILFTELNDKVFGGEIK